MFMWNLKGEQEFSRWTREVGHVRTVRRKHTYRLGDEKDHVTGFGTWTRQCEGPKYKARQDGSGSFSRTLGKSFHRASESGFL